jgi:hypothetical protein
MTTTPQTSRDCGHDDINPIYNECVSWHSYHLMDVVMTMPKYVGETMKPMMGGKRTTTTKTSHTVTTTITTRATMSDSLDKEKTRNATLEHVKVCGGNHGTHDGGAQGQQQKRQVSSCP